MDVFDISTEVEDHLSINQSREYEALTCQSTGIPTVSRLKHAKSLLHARTIKSCNATLCTSKNEDEIHQAHSAQDRLECR